jgi:hydroxylamine reductase
MSEAQMFCFQCEQTAKGKHCTTFGVCGKNPEVAALQDLLIHALMGLSKVAVEARKLRITDEEVNIFICEAPFSTLTNVNFDPKRFIKLIKKTAELRDSLRKKVEAAGGLVMWPMSSLFIPKDTLEELVEQGKTEGYKAKPGFDEDTHSLKNILIYGIKGVAAYADHAYILGQKDDKVFSFIHEGLAAVLDKSLSQEEELLGLVLKSGEINFRAIELLDAGNTGTYGHPVPTKVPLGVKKGKAILVSGHDLRDLEEILKQTAGKGICVYIHGEMLPAHGYPEHKKYTPFFGHYGTAWQNQQKEFKEFLGAILITTNCLMEPFESYKGNIFTMGLIGWPGVTHIEEDFTPVIEKALEMPGFQEDKENKHVMVGFARNTILSVADKVVEAVKSKNLRHILLVGGCDGAKPGRNYYTELVEKAPEDTIILTLACGKFRFFDKALGTIGDIPRLLDVGQCNNAYSAIKVALALSDVFGVGVNDLPLSIVCSWYEQKAVVIFLTLLYLGIKNIRLGPSLPAFIALNVLSILVKNFNIIPITTPEKDLKAILG